MQMSKFRDGFSPEIHLILTNYTAVILYTVYEDLRNRSQGNRTLDKGGWCMYYEVYLDSIFLICFCMNRYLLGLTALHLSCAATHGRLWLGAAVGAVGNLLVLLFPAAMMPLRIILYAVCLYGMAGITFRCWWGRGLLKIAESLCVCFFLLGGVLVMLLRLLPGKEGWLASGATVLLLGAGCYEGIRLLALHRRRSEEGCRVTLRGADGRSVQVDGLVDTGNSLREPISGRPVAVLERRIWEELYPGETPSGMRVIPYHSVGKPAGILSGYPMKSIEVELGGIRRICEDVYVAIWQGGLSETGSYGILLQPSMFEG